MRKYVCVGMQACGLCVQEDLHHLHTSVCANRTRANVVLTECVYVFRFGGFSTAEGGW